MNGRNDRRDEILLHPIPFSGYEYFGQGILAIFGISSSEYAESLEICFSQRRTRNT